MQNAHRRRYRKSRDFAATRDEYKLCITGMNFCKGAEEQGKVLVLLCIPNIEEIRL